MKRTQLISLLIGFAVITIIAADASAYYAPRLNRFLQRDPLGYKDGMNLYQYELGTPITGLDPSGQVLVVLSGAYSSEASMDSLRNATKREIETRLERRWPGSGLTLKIINHSGGEFDEEYDALLRADYKAFLARRKKTPCSLEQFVAIGHSSGASAISNEIVAGTFRPVYVMGLSGQRRVSPVFFGLVDQILGQKDLRGVRGALLGYRTSIVHYKQVITFPVKGVLNINILKDHINIVKDARVVKGISEEAGWSYYYEATREWPASRDWIKHTPHW